MLLASFDNYTSAKENENAVINGVLAKDSSF